MYRFQIVDSMFDTVTISLNGTNINKNSGKYAYRSYITKLLSYPEAAKMSWMQSEGWYEDTVAKYDPSQYAVDTTGFKQAFHDSSRKREGP